MSDYLHIMTCSYLQAIEDYLKQRNITKEKDVEQLYLANK